MMVIEAKPRLKKKQLNDFQGLGRRPSGVAYNHKMAVAMYKTRTYELMTNDLCQDWLNKAL